MKNSVSRLALTVLFLLCMALPFQSLVAQQTPVLLKDIAVGIAAGEPYGLVVVGDKLVFGADDGFTGRELWATDGTADGTIMLAEINSSEYGSIGGVVDPNWYVAEGLGLCFVNAFSDTYGYECWVTDGTVEGTRMLKDINPGHWIGCGTNYYFEYKNHVYFSAFDDQLWRTDGTEEGTELFKVIWEGDNPDILYPVIFDDMMYFLANDSDHGRELWRTDGTVEGTEMAVEVNTEDYWGALGWLTVLDDIMIFSGNDSICGFELWRSDGTQEGTWLVKDINKGGDSQIQIITVCNDRAFFWADDGVHGAELWVTDGTEEGTFMTKDIREGENGSYPNHFACMDHKLYFKAADEEFGKELWASDGTEEGTNLVIDISPGSSNPAELYVINETLFFSASHPEYGGELFESDGTSEGTKVYNIHPTYNSSPRHFVEFLGHLYLVADDGTHGTEIMKLEGTWGKKDVKSYASALSIYPNPFGTQTLIKWYLPGAGDVVINVYNMLGEEIATLDCGYRTPGNHQIEFNGSEFPAGLYFCQLQVNGSSGVSKMLISH